MSAMYYQNGPEKYDNSLQEQPLPALSSSDSVRCEMCGRECPLRQVQKGPNVGRPYRGCPGKYDRMYPCADPHFEWADGDQRSRTEQQKPAQQQQQVPAASRAVPTAAYQEDIEKAITTGFSEMVATLKSLDARLSQMIPLLAHQHHAKSSMDDDK